MLSIRRDLYSITIRCNGHGCCFGWSFLSNDCLCCSGCGLRSNRLLSSIVYRFSRRCIFWFAGLLRQRRYWVCCLSDDALPPIESKSEGCQYSHCNSDCDQGEVLIPETHCDRCIGSQERTRSFLPLRVPAFEQLRLIVKGGILSIHIGRIVARRQMEDQVELDDASPIKR